MLHAFLTYINEQKLCEPSEKVLLTVSGGKDSVAMLELFCRANRSEGSFQLAVAHCNFQLRGKDSDDDQIFVENLCKQNKIELTISFLLHMGQIFMNSYPFQSYSVHLPYLRIFRLK